jgi:tetratricopeptide (TPR) repeat protein
LKARHRAWAILPFLGAAPAWGGTPPPPVSLTLFGLYASPVEPAGLAAGTVDGAGGELLGEWNPSSYGSLGLGFETTTYFNAASFSLSILNLEGRVFPFENGRNRFSPYLYGGAGLVLNSGSQIEFKAGLGSRVSVMGPVFLDLAVGSHWFQDPGGFQTVDLRAGLSYGFDFGKGGNSAAGEEKSAPPAGTGKPHPSPTATPVPSPAAEVPAKAEPTPTAGIILAEDLEPPTATPTVETLRVETEAPPAQAPRKAEWKKAAAVPSEPPARGMKPDYEKGARAFEAGDYGAAARWFKKSVAIPDGLVPRYYYAEAYATLGVIYEFHLKVPGHLRRALAYYRTALRYDPVNTKSANKYYWKLKKRLERSPE